MPRFRVPVFITLTARDATHAYAKVAHSSVTSLEIPGLLRITTRAATPVPRRRRARKQATSSTDGGSCPLRCPRRTRV
jgi:hypothetical protein